MSAKYILIFYSAPLDHKNKMNIFIVAAHPTKPQRTAAAARVIVRKSLDLQLQGPAMLLKTLSALLNQARLAPTDLAGVKVIQGAAHFTTARLCVIVANMIGWSLSIPVTAVGSFASRARFITPIYAKNPV